MPHSTHLQHPQLALVSSNAQKRAEFERLGLHGLQLKAGIDLPEVLDSNPVTVTLYKSQSAGPHTIIEDTSLHIEGVDIGTNIRWQLDALNDLVGRAARFSVYLGHNDGNNVYVYCAHLDGHIRAPQQLVGPDAFGFDPYFVPVGTDQSLYQLAQQGRKDVYSSRALALQRLFSHQYEVSVPLQSIAPWSGLYQDHAPTVPPPRGT